MKKIIIFFALSFFVLSCKNKIEDAPNIVITMSLLSLFRDKPIPIIVLTNQDVKTLREYVGDSIKYLDVEKWNYQINTKDLQKIMQIDVLKDTTNNYCSLLIEIIHNNEYVEYILSRENGLTFLDEVEKNLSNYKIDILESNLKSLKNGVKRYLPINDYKLIKNN